MIGDCTKTCDGVITCECDSIPVTITTIPIEDAWKVYELFSAMRLHFTNERYDFFRFRGKVKGVTAERYLKVPMKWKYARFMRIYNTLDDIRECFLANFLDDPHIWINAVSTDKHRNFKEYLKHIGSPPKDINFEDGDVFPLAIALDLGYDLPNPTSLIGNDKAFQVRKARPFINRLKPVQELLQKERTK